MRQGRAEVVDVAKARTDARLELAEFPVSYVFHCWSARNRRGGMRGSGQACPLSIARARHAYDVPAR